MVKKEMCIFSVAFILALSTESFSNEPILLDRWDRPVYYGSKIILHKKILYVYDQSDSKVKTYNISNGFPWSKFLWETSGGGSGPGELPNGAPINNLVINPPNDELWISHRLGYSVFDRNGQFIRQITMPYNESCLVVNGDRWCMTSINYWQNRKLMSLVRVGLKQPLWEIPFPNGIPVTARGAFIKPNPELYYQDGQYIYYNSSIGELALVDPDGEVELLVQLKQYFEETFTPVDYINSFEYGKDSLKICNIPYAYSGLIKSDKKITLLRLAYSGGVVTDKGETKVSRYENGNYKPIKVITEISATTGEILGEYFHPICLHWLYLLDIEEDIFTFFDLETGDHIYQLKISDLQQIRKYLF